MAARARPAIERRSDWEQRLADFLAAAAERPHRYGSSDCLMTALGAVRAVSGRDFARGHRGKYRSAAGARRYLTALGFASPAVALDSVLERRPRAFAQRGDIVLVTRRSALFAKRPRWNVPAICIGGEAVAPGEAGLVRFPRSEWVRAWKV